MNFWPKQAVEGALDSNFTSKQSFFGIKTLVFTHNFMYRKQCVEIHYLDIGISNSFDYTKCICKLIP